MYTTTLEKRKAAHLYRTRRAIESAPGPEVIVEGVRYLNFCSNDYLGLANHPKVVKSFRQAADRFGVGSTGSHLMSGHHRAHRALEEELADFLKRPAALVFSSGTLANLGTLNALVSSGGTVIADRLVHASLIDAIRLSHARLQRYRHACVDSLARQLAKTDPQKKLVVTEGVFSMDGDTAPLPEIATTAQAANALLYVDDAHGIGVQGTGGRGTVAEFGLSVKEVPVVVGTFGKAFGTFGAFVSGTRDFIDYLVQCARTYMYTTALPPAIAEATRTSLAIIRQDTGRQAYLKTLIARFRQNALALGLPLMPSETPIQPLLVGASEQTLAISEHLWEAGIFIPAIRPPTVPPHQARLRITLTAAHAEAQVDILVEKLFAAWKAKNTPTSNASGRGEKTQPLHS